MTSKSLSGVLVLGTAISGVVGGVVGGLVVLAGSSLSSDPSPPVVPAAPPEVVAESGQLVQVEEPTPVELLEPRVPAAAYPTKPGPLDSNPAQETPPYSPTFALPKDASDFVREQVQAACAGEVDSMLRVSEWIAVGNVLPQSTPGANHWLRRARSQCSSDPNDSEALRVLRAHAQFLAYPSSAPWANQPAAVELLEQSARATSLGYDLWLDLATLLERGHGTAPDPERARNIARRIAELLLARGHQGLDESRAYETCARYAVAGVGAAPDAREGAVWYRRAIEARPPYLVNDDQFVPVIALYGELEEVPGGVLWLRHHTEKHSVPAYFLARCHEHGTHGVQQDLPQALVYYRQALKLEHAHAAQDVARLEDSTLEVEAPADK